MRIDYKQHLSIVRPMRELGQAGHEGSLEPILMELVKVRASQLNRCAHCLEMHTKDARAMGESDDRLHLVAAWREAPVFSERERAALRWCEELTLLAERDVPDELYDETRRVFSEDELCQLTLVIVTINAWNRFAVAFRAPVGNYVPRAHAAAGHRSSGSVKPPCGFPVALRCALGRVARPTQSTAQLPMSNGAPPAASGTT